MPNLWLIFTTGLLTGGLTCLAVQGGLLAATLAQNEEEELKKKTLKSGNALPILAFLGAKLAAYTILGLLLGALGSVFQLSVTTRAILQLLVVVFMVGSALNLLNVHPIFRYFVIQPPRFLTQILRNQTKSESLFAPAILGALTIFIPCGTTQAMMALAIGSGSPLSGGLILFSFILGTSPVFFILGYLATRAGDVLQQKFMRVAAIVIILLAVYNLDGALALLGSNWTLGSIGKGFYCTVTFCGDVSATVAPDAAAVTAATVFIDEASYSVDNPVLKAGAQINLKVVNRGGRGCIQAFTIPSLGIQKIVRPGTEQAITFQAPSQPGRLNFMCSMGMYRGSFQISV